MPPLVTPGLWSIHESLVSVKLEDITGRQASVYKLYLQLDKGAAYTSVVYFSVVPDDPGVPADENFTGTLPISTVAVVFVSMCGP
eukprot:1181663-Prorocentrum_minimum.AAC.2